MFDAVLESNGPRRPIGRGAIASIAVHALLLGGALYLSAHSHDDKPKLDRVVTFFNPPAPPPPPPPPPPGGGQRSHAKIEPKKIIKKPDTVVQTDKPVEPTPAEPTKSDPEPAGQPGGVAGGVAGGVLGGVVGGTVGGTLGNPLPKAPSSVLPFGPGMNRPTLLAHADPVYTREALVAKIGGLMLVKCVITVTGSLRDCHIIKGLPMMDQAVLSALATWRYTPITFQGQPVSVEYVIPVRLVPP